MVKSAKNRLLRFLVVVRTYSLINFTFARSFASSCGNRNNDHTDPFFDLDNTFLKLSFHHD